MIDAPPPPLARATAGVSPARVTEESLATAIHRVWPYRRNTQSEMTLSATAILAALKTAR